MNSLPLIPLRNILIKQAKLIQLKLGGDIYDDFEDSIELVIPLKDNSGGTFFHKHQNVLFMTTYAPNKIYELLSLKHLIVFLTPIFVKKGFEYLAASCDNEKVGVLYEKIGLDKINDNLYAKRLSI